MVTLLDRQTVIMQAVADLYSYRAANNANIVLTHEAAEFLARHLFQTELVTRGLSPRRGCTTRRHSPPTVDPA